MRSPSDRRLDARPRARVRAPVPPTLACPASPPSACRSPRNVDYYLHGWRLVYHRARRPDRRRGDITVYDPRDGQKMCAARHRRGCTRLRPCAPRVRHPAPPTSPPPPRAAPPHRPRSLASPPPQTPRSPAAPTVAASPSWRSSAGAGRGDRRAAVVDARWTRAPRAAT